MPRRNVGNVRAVQLRHITSSSRITYVECSWVLSIGATSLCIPFHVSK